MLVGREKAEGGYQCGACGRERQLIREMQQHLLCHSDSKFYLCVRCLKGFNDTFDMKRHTRKHTSEYFRPYFHLPLNCSHPFSRSRTHLFLRLLPSMLLLCCWCYFLIMLSWVAMYCEMMNWNTNGSDWIRHYGMG